MIHAIIQCVLSGPEFEAGRRRLFWLHGNPEPRS